MTRSGARDPTEIEELRQLFNEYLKNDGFALVDKARMSGRPIFVSRNIGLVGVPGLAAARETLAGADPSYVARQITRMETAVSRTMIYARLAELEAASNVSSRRGARPATRS